MSQAGQFGWLTLYQLLLELLYMENLACVRSVHNITVSSETFLMDWPFLARPPDFGCWVLGRVGFCLSFCRIVVSLQMFCLNPVIAESKILKSVNAQSFSLLKYQRHGYSVFY